MRSTRLNALLVAALAIPVLGTPTPAAAATASAGIVSTPGTVYVSADRTYINVRVTYRCTNTAQVKYYLTGQISQSDVPDVHYSVGVRTETGLVEATCTGARVTKTYRHLRSWWWGTPETQPRLHAGSATFRFHLDARAATGSGWYTDMQPDAKVARTVTVVTG